MSRKSAPTPLDPACEQEKAASIDRYKRALLHALKEYREMAASEKDSMLTCQENAINYSTAADHILQQIKVIDERNMESAVASLENMGYADNHGAEVVLADYIDFSCRCLDETVELLGEKLEKSRQEYVSSRSSSEFIDEALETNYANLRSTYSGLLKDVERRSALNDKQWIKFEGECRQWQVQQMADILNKYQGPNNSMEKNYKELRKKVNKRLSDFVNVFLHKVQSDLRESEVDLKLAHVAAVRETVRWKNETQLELETWLSSTIDELNDTYTEHLEKYRNLILDIRHHSYSLETHCTKLNQLSKLYRLVSSCAVGPHILKRKHYASIIQGIDPNSTSESKSSDVNFRYPLSAILHASDSSSSRTVGGQERAPAWTLTLGTRMFELGRRVGVPVDELALSLQDMLYDLPDSEALNEKLALVCGVYNINVKAMM